MRLATFTVDSPIGRQTRLGVVADESTYLDVTVGHAALLEADGDSAPYEVATVITPPEMVPFLERGQRAMDAARRVLDTFGAESTESWNGRQFRYDAEAVDLLSPLPRPASLRDAMVYEEHTKNTFGDDIPDVWHEQPVYYKGNHNSVVAPDTDVVWPNYSEEMDYELELAAVVGKRGRDIDAEEADQYIAGYTVFNDFSARDTQFREMEANLGPAKGKDFANGLGPYLTTADAIDVGEVEMTARVNGNTWSEGSPGTMHHTFADIVAHVSTSETIYPGEVIGSGTVSRGCGLELGELLSDGDAVELEVEGIGTLRHRIVRSA